jgi:uncharacterized protein (DUF1810 family)
VPDLARFRIAQDDADSGFADALEELRGGRKTSHWIWYVFPQLGGLGSSPLAREYALSGPLEAEAYLRDPVLGERLLRIAEVASRKLHASPAVPLRTLMGSHIDALKIVSSMTLFGFVARRLNAVEPNPRYARTAEIADAILAVASAQGYPRCAHTEARLRATG